MLNMSPYTVTTGFIRQYISNNTFESNQDIRAYIYVYSNFYYTLFFILSNFLSVALTFEPIGSHRRHQSKNNLTNKLFF